MQVSESDFSIQLLGAGAAAAAYGKQASQPDATVLVSSKLQTGWHLLTCQNKSSGKIFSNHTHW